MAVDDARGGSNGTASLLAWLSGWLAGTAPSARINASRWLDERVANAGFRLRLVKMALRRMNNLPVGLMMAIEAPEHDIDWLHEPDRALDAHGL